MPYTSTEELPKGVKNVLPKHAQEVYKEAFDNAYQEYADPADRRENVNREETAHRVAWASVKKAGYEKGEDDTWHKS